MCFFVGQMIFLNCSACIVCLVVVPRWTWALEMLSLGAEVECKGIYGEWLHNHYTYCFFNRSFSLFPNCLMVLWHCPYLTLAINIISSGGWQHIIMKYSYFTSGDPQQIYGRRFLTYLSGKEVRTTLMRSWDQLTFDLHFNRVIRHPLLLFLCQLT